MIIQDWFSLKFPLILHLYRTTSAYLTSNFICYVDSVLVKVTGTIIAGLIIFEFVCISVLFILIFDCIRSWTNGSINKMTLGKCLHILFVEFKFTMIIWCKCIWYVIRLLLGLLYMRVCMFRIAINYWSFSYVCFSDKTMY